MSTLKDKRLELGISQAKLAELAGVSAQQISAIENGASVPTAETMLLIANALKASPYELHPGFFLPVPPVVAALIHNWHRIPLHTQLALAKTLESGEFWAP